MLENTQEREANAPNGGGGLVRLIGEVSEESDRAGRLLGKLLVPHLDVRHKDLYFAPDIAVE